MNDEYVDERSPLNFEGFFKCWHPEVEDDLVYAQMNLFKSILMPLEYLGYDE